MRTALHEHLETLLACRGCPAVLGEPVVGFVPGARILLVGQAPGEREVVDRRPFAFTAGKRLFEWFRRVGVGEDEFRRKVYIAAVIRCFPGKNQSGGGDRVPDQGEIDRCGKHLDQEIALLRPQLVIAVGTLASAQFLGSAPLVAVTGKIHRATRAGRSFYLIVLPHPSGRSTWLNRPEHAVLLERSLQLLAQHPQFRVTFPSRVDPQEREAFRP